MKWLMTILGKGKKSKRGFTLIELLFVVIVIAILAAAGVAMYVRSLDKARAAEGLAILSSVRTHYLVEIAENDEPPAIPADLGITAGNSWGIDTSRNKWWKETETDDGSVGFVASFPGYVVTGDLTNNSVALTGNADTIIDEVILTINVETGDITQLYP